MNPMQSSKIERVFEYDMRKRDHLRMHLKGYGLLRVRNEQHGQRCDEDIRASPCNANGYEGSHFTAGIIYVETIWVRIGWYWSSDSLLIWLLSMVLWLRTYIGFWRTSIAVCVKNSSPLVFHDRERNQVGKFMPEVTSRFAYTERASETML